MKREGAKIKIFSVLPVFFSNEKGKIAPGRTEWYNRESNGEGGVTVKKALISEMIVSRMKTIRIMFAHRILSGSS